VIFTVQQTHRKCIHTSSAKTHYRLLLQKKSYARKIMVGHGVTIFGLATDG